MTTTRVRFDGMTLAGLALLLLFAFSIVRGRMGDVTLPDFGPAADTAVATPAAADPAAPPGATGEVTAIDLAWHTAIGLPYDTYFLTQGTHGESYGHFAVDIAAGNGSVIKSLINGVVAATGYDQWGNTYIQIDNDVYSVLYLHGVYSLLPGDEVSVGQAIGTESNIGYTLDRWGNLCAGRNFGYHTHLNVFDKRVGSNIDPLTLIPATYP